MSSIDVAYCRMSKIDELFNFEAAKSSKNQSKYSLDRSNAFYSMLTRSKRKIKYCDEKLIRVYSAEKWIAETLN